MQTSPPAEALVIVPFATQQEANDWADRISVDYPLEVPLLVTSGGEAIVIDRQTGKAHHELTFAGGWRAKVADAHNGVVTIARPTTDSEFASLRSAP